MPSISIHIFNIFSKNRKLNKKLNSTQLNGGNVQSNVESIEMILQGHSNG